MNAWDIEFSDSEVQQATNLYCTEENYLRIKDSQNILTSVFYSLISVINVYFCDPYEEASADGTVTC